MLLRIRPANQKYSETQFGYHLLYTQKREKNRIGIIAYIFEREEAKRSNRQWVLEEAEIWNGEHVKSLQFITKSMQDSPCFQFLTILLRVPVKIIP